MTTDLIILLGVFFVLLALRMPVAFALGLAAVCAALAAALPDAVAMGTAWPTVNATLQNLVLRMAQGIYVPALMPIPFFIFAGELMSTGNVARRLVALANLVIGSVRGGLGMVNVMVCMFFGGITGSSVAEASAVGSLMVPMMEDEGYDRDYAAALTVGASTQGIIIPPSHNAIIYSLAAAGVVSVSIAELFLGGLIPGVLIGVTLMVANYFISHARRYPVRQRRITWREAGRVLWEGALAMLTPIIIVVGIVGIPPWIQGFFTATEAGAVAAIYAFLLTFIIHRDLPLRELPGILKRSVITISIVMLLIATSSAFGLVLAQQRVPEALTAAMLSISESPVLLLLILNVGLLIIGTFMDMAPAILILTPILLPAVTEMGMSPVHFGIMLMLNLAIGLTTPPVGTTMFVGCAIGRTTVERLSRSLILIWPAMVTALLLVTYIPQLTLWVPGLLSR
jgi:tripartite ATP-independent transporter DctM subunit